MLISAISSPSANSYVTTADADQYFTLRRNSEWLELSIDQKEGALIRATDYIEATYFSSWKGLPTTGKQSLSWPREDVVINEDVLNENIIPQQVKKATFEMAIRASRGELIADEGQRVVEEKVDVLTVKYYEHSDAVTKYNFVNRILSPLLCTTSGSGFQSIQLKRV